MVKREKKTTGSAKKKESIIIKSISGFQVKLKQFFIWVVKNKVKIILITAALLLIVSVYNFVQDEPFYIRILPGERGIVFNNFGGGISDNILGEGTHFIISGFQTAYRANVSRQSANIEHITADSKEFQDVALWINVEFQLTEETLPDFFRTYGVKSSAEIINDIIIPNANEITKNIIINYPIGEVLPNQEEIKRKIIKGLSPVLNEYFINVIDIDIVNIKLDPGFRDIIAETEYSEYEKERQRLLLEAAEIEAERSILNAETLKVQKILEAEAVREYNRLISEREFDRTLLEYMRIENQKFAIEKWDGRLPSQIESGDEMPFLDDQYE